MNKRIDECYTRLLRIALNISWKDKINNITLYNGLSRISEVLKERRLKFAGHLMRHDNEIAHKLVFGYRQMVVQEEVAKPSLL